MKRTIVAALVILFSGSAFAEGQRYLVATRRPFREGVLKVIVGETRDRLAPRDVTGFETFTGFAAELTASEVAELRRSSHVRWVEPVIPRYAVATSRNTSAQTVPYGIDLVHAREAWSGARAGIVNVAVLDTGVDYRHDELKGIYVDGANMLDATKPPLDDGSHGTHVAGTIAAADNGFGVVGIAPQAQTRLWAVKVLNGAGAGTNENIVKGIDWVVRQKGISGGNWIINLSLGSPFSSPSEKESIQRAVDAGVLIVAASGNESTDKVKNPVIYPAAYPGVIAVGAIDETETVAVFSNQGTELDLVAPGVGVLSTIPVGLNFVGSLTSAGQEYNATPLGASEAGTFTSEFVYCGLGHPDQFPASVRGKIALIKRGELTFAMKTKNAVDAGAIAVVIFNNVVGPTTWTLRSDQDPWSYAYDFPVAIAVSKTDGEALMQQSNAITVASEADDYSYGDGTSMASPHVAGAAALIWSMAPNATAREVADALTSTAIDRGKRGFDTAYGAGVVDVLAAARRLAPFAFAGPPTTGRPMGKRR
jgi:serine protease